MFRKFDIILFLLYAGISISNCNRNEEVLREKENVLEEETTSPYDRINEIDIEDAIQKVESLALTTQQISKLNDLPLQESENFYNYMITAIDDINEAIKHSDNIFKFIKANGFLRILSNNLMNTHLKLRAKLLLFLKDMFDVAPAAVDSLLPLNIVDRLLDIFENDNNMELKAHALDILHKWLPNNPNAQVRVMKIKGLETFYNQMDKLDVGVITTLMELFNKILKEHLDVRNNKAQVAQDDGEKLVLYQRIGLLERMSTPLVCNGLLNIFEMLWSYNNESDNMKTVLDLVKNVKPFCSKIYRKKSKATDLFEALLKYVKNEDRKEYFEKHNVDVADVVKVIEEYLDTEKHSNTKDEF